MKLNLILPVIVALLRSPSVTGSQISLLDGPNPVIDLGYVKYKGVNRSDVNITSWYGIRYAASPSGDLRWRAPVPIEMTHNYSSPQILDATEIGPSCLQGVPPAYAGYNLGVTQSEDCLLLNVHIPSTPARPKLPVIVEIHGGGYIIGNAEGAPGDLLMKESRNNLIYIDIQYRLGGLGFLGGSAIASGGGANAGFLDQRAALHWVQRHVAAFGGDPAQVTIYGGSAGAGSVTAQMQMQGRRPRAPFRAAIAEYLWWQTYHDSCYAEAQYERLLRTAGCEDLPCLRSLSFDALAAAINSTYVTAYADGVYGHSDTYYAPYVDGHVITEYPTQAFAAGNVARVPFFVDRDALEGLIFTNASINSSEGIHRELRTLWSAATDDFLTHLDSLYPISAFNGSQYFDSPIISATAPNTSLGQYLENVVPGITAAFGRNPYFYKLQQIIGDAQLNCATWFAAKGMVRRGIPTWKMVWNAGTLIHGSIDSALLSPWQPSFGPQSYPDMLRAYFVAFALSLDPNSNVTIKPVERLRWPQYSKSAKVLEWNMTAVEVASDPDASERCEFLYSNAHILRI